MVTIAKSYETRDCDHFSPSDACYACKFVTLKARFMVDRNGNVNSALPTADPT